MLSWRQKLGVLPDHGLGISLREAGHDQEVSYGEVCFRNLALTLFFGPGVCGAYFIVVDAIKRANSTDAAKVRNVTPATKDFNGVTGRITLKSDGDPIKAMVIDKVQGES